MGSTEEFLSHFKGNQIFVSMPEFNTAPWHLAGEYSAVCDKLRKNNEEKKHGIFFTVNELDQSLDPGRKRTKKMVTRIRASFMDDDTQRNSPRDDFPLSPSIIVNSSPGKYHYYWLTSTDDFDAWNKVQNEIMKLYDGDRNAKDMTRYLRLPGYNHNKDKENPFKVTWQGTGIEYDWEMVKNAFPVTTASPANDEKMTSSDAQTLIEIVDIIETGKPGVHGAINKMAYMMKLEGASDSWIISTIKLHMDRNPLKDERWQSRYDEIERSVAGLSDHDYIDKLSTPKLAEPIKDIDWPPGLMGDLAKNVYEHSDYPYKLVSTITALGLVAGISGRKFNVSNTGCNIYMTLLMPTGSGKDIIQTYITNVLSSIAPMSNPLQFLASKKHTGPKALMDELQEKASCLAVYTEAGMLFKSSAGDSHGLLRAILDLFSKSGNNSYSIGERYSNKDNDILTLRAPCLSIINEATPSTFISELDSRGSIESGELARMHIFRYEVPKPYRQRPSADIKLPLNVEERLIDLIALCGGQCTVGGNTDPEAERIRYPELEFSKFEKACVDEENRCMHEDTLRKSMVSRAPLKCLKVAALLAIMDKGPITLEHWEWALKLYHYEMSLLSTLMEGSAGGEIDLVVEAVVMPAIVKMMNNEYKDKRKQLNKNMRDRGMFTYSNLNQCVRNNRSLKELDTQYKAGLNICIDHMLSTGLLLNVEKTPLVKSTKVYKVSPEFHRVWELAQG